MKEHDVKEYLEKGHGKYLLVNSLSRRVRDLQSGYKPLIAHPPGDLSDVATSEFAQDKIKVCTLTEVIDEPRPK